MARVLDRTVPFRLPGGPNPLLLVPTWVNDSGPYDFILDTGASHTLISPTLASSLGVHPESERKGMGAGGAVTLALAHLDSLAVGAARAEQVQVGMTSELARIGSAIGAAVDGALGYGFLKDFRISVDYKAGTIRLTPAALQGDDARPIDAVSFALAAPAKPLIIVQAFVDGSGPLIFALDTGASRTVLAPDLASRLGLQTTAAQTGTGGGGSVQMYPGRVGTLAVGDAVVHDHDIVVGDWMKMISAAAGVELHGILGYNFLNCFELTIDYPESWVTLASASGHGI